MEWSAISSLLFLHALIITLHYSLSVRVDFNLWCIRDFYFWCVVLRAPKSPVEKMFCLAAVPKKKKKKVILSQRYTLYLSCGEACVGQRKWRVKDLLLRPAHICFYFAFRFCTSPNQCLCVFLYFPGAATESFGFKLLRLNAKRFLFSFDMPPALQIRAGGK